MRTLIENGTLVTASDTFEADLLIENEKIAAIGKGQTFEKIDKRIDARGKYVIPGGIDVHTHLDMPFGGTTSADDFESGTRSAAFGGTTCVVDFAIQPTGGSLKQGVLFELPFDVGGQIQVRELQQLDGLHQLRRHHERVALSDLESLGERHFDGGRAIWSKSCLSGSRHRVHLHDGASLEHDPEKACPGLDPGWIHFSEKDHAPPMM